MPWFAVYETATGKLVSIGTVVADPLPPGIASKQLSQKPDLEQVDWDAATLDFVAIPPPPP